MAETRALRGDFFISLGTLERVPSLLRFITWVSFLGGAIIIPLFIFLPLAGGVITVNGESFTWQEYWKRGDALISLIYGLTLLPISYGVLGKKRWVRLFLVCYPVIQILSIGIVGFLFKHSETLRFFNNFKSTKDVLWYVLYLSVWVSLATWYLYHKKRSLISFQLMNLRLILKVSRTSGCVEKLYNFHLS